MSSIQETRALHIDNEGSVLLTKTTPFFKFKKRFLAKAKKEGFFGVFDTKELNLEEVTALTMLQSTLQANMPNARDSVLKKHSELERKYNAWVEKCRKAQVLLLECLDAPVSVLLESTVPEYDEQGEKGVRAIWQYVCKKYGAHDVDIERRNRSDLNSMTPCQTVNEFQAGLAQIKEYFREQDSWTVKEVAEGVERITFSAAWSEANRVDFIYRWVQVPELRRIVDILRDDRNRTLAEVEERLTAAADMLDKQALGRVSVEPLSKASVSAAMSNKHGREEEHLEEKEDDTRRGRDESGGEGRRRGKMANYASTPTQPRTCYRCGRAGHRAFECFSHKTMDGKVLPTETRAAPKTPAKKHPRPGGGSQGGVGNGSEDRLLKRIADLEARLGGSGSGGAGAQGLPHKKRGPASVNATIRYDEEEEDS